MYPDLMFRGTWSSSVTTCLKCWPNSVWLPTSRALSTWSRAGEAVADNRMDSGSSSPMDQVARWAGLCLFHRYLFSQDSPLRNTCHCFPWSPGWIWICCCFSASHFRYRRGKRVLWTSAVARSPWCTRTRMDTSWWWVMLLLLLRGTWKPGPRPACAV